MRPAIIFDLDGTLWDATGCVPDIWNRVFDRHEEVRLRLTGYGIRALMVIALFIGSCLLCIAAAIAGEGTATAITFLTVGTIGYAVSIFFAYRLYRNMKKGK